MLVSVDDYYRLADVIWGESLVTLHLVKSDSEGGNCFLVVKGRRVWRQYYDQVLLVDKDQKVDSDSLPTFAPKLFGGYTICSISLGAQSITIKATPWSTAKNARKKPMKPRVVTNNASTAEIVRLLDQHLKRNGEAFYYEEGWSDDKVAEAITSQKLTGQHIMRVRQSVYGPLRVLKPAAPTSGEIDIMKKLDEMAVLLLRLETRLNDHQTRLTKLEQEWGL
jgi:hypothetical protein